MPNRDWIIDPDEWLARRLADEQRRMRNKSRRMIASVIGLLVLTTAAAWFGYL